MTAPGLAVRHVDMSTSKTRKRQGWLGELEHMLLLSILRLGDEAYAPAISEIMEERAGRRLSRGALYSTLDRMERKGLLEWTIHPATQARAGHRRRLFALTPGGLEAVRVSHTAIRELADGLSRQLLEEPRS